MQIQFHQWWKVCSHLLSCKDVWEQYSYFRLSNVWLHTRPSSPGLSEMKECRLFPSTLTAKICLESDDIVMFFKQHIRKIEKTRTEKTPKTSAWFITTMHPFCRHPKLLLVDPQRCIINSFPFIHERGGGLLFLGKSCYIVVEPPSSCYMFHCDSLRQEAFISRLLTYLAAT